MTWAIHEPDLDRRFALAQEAGYDPGSIISGRRERPDGVFVEWRLGVQKDMVSPGGGVVPFLIEWGDTPHPAPNVTQGSRLVSFRAEHPEPASVGPMLQALDVELAVTEGPRPALIAVIDTPSGQVELS